MLVWLYIPAPVPAVLPLKIQLISTGVIVLSLYTPPALPGAEFPTNAQSVSVGLPPRLEIPPPMVVASLLLNTQAVSVGLLALL